MEKRHGTLERQAYVLIREESEERRGFGPAYHVAQQDGTRGVATNGGFTAQGPAVLKVSARLLKGPPEFETSSPIAGDTQRLRFVRTVSPVGVITWTEVGGFGNELTITFFKDSMSAVGGDAGRWAMGFFDNLFSQSEPGG